MEWGSRSSNSNEQQGAARKKKKEPQQPARCSRRGLTEGKRTKMKRLLLLLRRRSAGSLSHEMNALDEFEIPSRRRKEEATRQEEEERGPDLFSSPRCSTSTLSSSSGSYRKKTRDDFRALLLLFPICSLSLMILLPERDRRGPSGRDAAKREESERKLGPPLFLYLSFLSLLLAGKEEKKNVRRDCRGTLFLSLSLSPAAPACAFFFPCSRNRKEVRDV